MSEDRAQSGWTFNPKATAAQRQAEERRHTEAGLVRTWSFSTLQNFESCPYSVYLSKIEKRPRIKGPAAERGDQIHNHAEKYVNGSLDELGEGAPSCKGWEHFQDDFDKLRELYATGTVELEQNWGFRKDWSQTGFFDDDVWGRMKLDAMVHESETSARIIDHKSGQKKGNEVKHASQAITYAIGAFKRYPKLRNVSTNFWYLDHNDVLKRSFTRQQADLLEPRLMARALRLTTARFFPPQPGSFRCRFCDQRENCEYSKAAT